MIDQERLNSTLHNLTEEIAKVNDQVRVKKER